MDLFEIDRQLDELVDRARHEFVFDDDFDKDLFCSAMKNCFEYFIKNRDVDKPFETQEVGVYSKIYAYSKIPAVTSGENGDLFEISTQIASDLSHLILFPNSFVVENDTMILGLIVDNEEVYLKYDFNLGDFSDYEKVRDEYGYLG